MAAVSPMLRPTTRHSTTSSFPATRSGWSPSTSLRCSGHGADRFTLTRGITAGHVPTGEHGARRSRSAAGAGASASTAGTIPGTTRGGGRDGVRAGARVGGPDGTADITGHTGRIITASTAAGALALCPGECRFGQPLPRDQQFGLPYRYDHFARGQLGQRQDVLPERRPQ